MTSLAPQAPRSLPPGVTAALAVGLFAQLSQILVFRELMALCHGTEILFGAILASGLLWTALGGLAASVLARFLKRRGAAMAACRTILAAALPLNGLLLVGQLYCVRVGSWFGAELAGRHLSIEASLVLAAFATLPAAFISGFEFVIALHSEPVEKFGALYRAESWGAVAGGLVFTFVLVFFLSPFAIALSAGIALAVVALALTAPRTAPVSRVVQAVSLCAMAALFFLPLDARSHRRKWSAILPDYTLTETRDTRYGQLAVLRSNDKSQFALFQNGSLLATIEPSAPSGDAAALAAVLACQHPDPRSVLLLGGGLGRLPEEIGRAHV